MFNVISRKAGLIAGLFAFWITGATPEETIAQWVGSSH
jgi:hypothetical protein